MEPKAPSEKVMRRLYSLYPEQVEKLSKLARARKMPASQYLRELIDVAFVAAFGEQKKSTIYGAD